MLALIIIFILSMIFVSALVVYCAIRASTVQTPAEECRQRADIAAEAECWANQKQDHEQSDVRGLQKVI